MSMRLMTYQAKIYEDPSDEKVGTCISAYMENCLLFIIQVDWGGIAYDYSKDGEVESFSDVTREVPNMKFVSIVISGGLLI